MSRLINADKLIEKAYWHGDAPSFDKPYADGHDAVDVEEIENAPAVDAVPVVHGHWNCLYDDSNVWRCSVCGEDWVLEDGNPIENNMHYCTNCGAKMDESAGNSDMLKDGEEV